VAGLPDVEVRPGVLMVTGAYYPELSGAGLQCRSLVGRLRHDVRFTVLTTTVDRSLALTDVQDDVPVERVFVNPTSWWSKTIATIRVTLAFVRHSARFSIVHLHGFSQKSMLIVALARAGGKRVAIKLTSVGHDDPMSMKRRGGLAYWLYSRADLFFAVSPRFVESYEQAGLPQPRLRLVPNGVDCRRFRPPAIGEREALRRELSIASTGPVVLFVGFFSREKRPDLLFDAWARLATSLAPDSTLVLVGATRSTYYEIDGQLAVRIREQARAAGLERRLLFVEATHEIEKFYRAADVFVLPSTREGLPNVLLEAMASGTACVATRLAGVTDTLIHDEQNGLLVPPDDGPALEGALGRLLQDPGFASRLGADARRTVEAGYALDKTAGEYLEAYRRLDEGRTCAA
jgi:glycosyltransferase involved in cell wall biosynthesis